MAQHDYEILNQTFPLTRQDINNLAAAVVTNNSGASEPTTMYNYQWWFDTNTNTLKFRNADNDAWISFATFDMVNDTVNLVDSAVDIVTDLSPQLGANLDLNSNDITGTGNINITGNVSLSVSAGNALLNLTNSSTASEMKIKSGVSGLTNESINITNEANDSMMIFDGTNKSILVGDIGYSGFRSAFGDFEIKNIDSSDTDGGKLVLSNRDGSITSNQILGSLHFASYDQNANSTGGVASIRATASETYAGSTGADLRFYTHPESANNGTLAGNTQERMRIDSSGNLLVGKTTTLLADTGVSMLSSGLTKIVVDGNVTTQLNRLTSDGEILNFRKDGTTVGTIGTGSGYIHIGKGDTGIGFASDDIIPYNTDTPGTRDNGIDLGGSGYRFKDLYLGGNIYLGGTTSANALDDYEEGTWTPSTPEGTITSTGKYTKIGRQVTVHLSNASFSNITSTEILEVTGLPFAIASGNQINGGSAMWSYTDTAGRHGNAFIDLSKVRFYDDSRTSAFDVMRYNDLNNAANSVYFIATYFTA